MATHDYVIANGTGASVRSDLNDALAAIVSQNSSATAPSTTYAYMTWADTTTGLFKIRNAANNAWITLYKLDGNFTDITLSAQGDLRFADSDSSNWVAFQAPATVASNVTWTLPSADGTSGQVLSTNGSGTLSWAAAGTSQWTTSGSDIYYTTGKVLVNTTSPTTVASGIGSRFEIQTAAVEYLQALFRHGGTTAANGAFMLLGRSRGTTVNSVTAVANGDTLGALDFRGANGVDYANQAATISCVVDAEPFTSGDTSDLPGRLVFSTTDDGAGTATERARITSTGELLVGTTTTTANGGKIQVSNGITFPATQVACSDVNTLDDYEEGTWTPVISGTTAAGAGTYSVQVGRYTKIGNKVTAHLNLTWSAHTGTGNMNIGGLPFTAANVTNLTPAAIAYANNLTITGIPALLVTANATTASINSVNNGAAAALAMDTAATITATLTYQAA